MKKLISVVLVLLLLLPITGCRSREKDKDAVEYKLSWDGAYYTLSYVGENIVELVVPEYYNGKPVLKIGDGACSMNQRPGGPNVSKLRRVTIEAKLTEIGRGAFSECDYLETINIPPTVTEIGDSAFSSCRSLKSIGIPTGVTRISQNLFFGCEALESIELHDRIEKIDFGAFCGCSSITEIYLPASVEFIGERAFSLMENLEKIKVSEDNYDYVTIDGNLYTKNKKTLLQYAPKNERESYTVPEGVKMIGEHAFAGSLNLKSITLPDSFKLLMISVYLLTDSGHILQTTTS